MKITALYILIEQEEFPFKERYVEIPISSETFEEIKSYMEVFENE